MIRASCKADGSDLEDFGATEPHKSWRTSLPAVPGGTHRPTKTISVYSSVPLTKIPLQLGGYSIAPSSLPSPPQNHPPSTKISCVPPQKSIANWPTTTPMPLEASSVASTQTTQSTHPLLAPPLPNVCTLPASVFSPPIAVETWPLHC